MSDKDRKLFGYLSMEIGFKPTIPTYSGGLGILAGDLLKSSADLGLDGVGVAPIYHHGYFKQRFENGWQKEDYPEYDPRADMELLPNTVTVQNEGRDFKVGAWRYDLEGQSGHRLPLLFLDTRVPGNETRDSDLSWGLYGGDQNTRIRQEIVLGMGGVQMLQDLGWEPETYHLNEGHGALAAVELLRQGMSYDEVKKRLVFTTHTPVPAGIDRFPYEGDRKNEADLKAGAVKAVLDGHVPSNVHELIKQYAMERCDGVDKLNMALLADRMARYTFGVSRLHGEVMREMLGNPAIDFITNGVHSYTWTADPMQKLFDEYLPGWRNDPAELANAHKIPRNALLKAHYDAKLDLFDAINSPNIVKTVDAPFDPNVLTIGFARRAATYKRGDLIFNDLDKLADIGNRRVQLIFAGKAHPKDEKGKEVLQRIQEKANAMKGRLSVAFLENYNMDLGRLLTSGCDVWLNAPRVREEACGTSGMKAAHNGVPHLSTYDGWWLEGNHQGGWSFGNPRESTDADAAMLYDAIERQVIPAYANPNVWAEQMRGAIRNAAHFNTHRAMKDYVEKAYGAQLPAAKKKSVFVMQPAAAAEPRRMVQ